MNSPLSLTGSVSAPGDDINFAAATVNYGDGSGSQSLTINSDGSFVLNHTYHSAAAYSILVTVPDTYGGVGTGTVAVTATANTFEVSTLTPTTSGFDVTFNRALNPSTRHFTVPARPWFPT